MFSTHRKSKDSFMFSYGNQPLTLYVLRLLKLEVILILQGCLRKHPQPDMENSNNKIYCIYITDVYLI